MMSFLRQLIIFFLLTSPIHANQTMAIIGDSISTGGATHQSLRFDMNRLMEILSGHREIEPEPKTLDWLRQQGIPFTDSMPAPNRLRPSTREFQDGLTWFFKHFIMQLAQSYVDTEQYSWGYMVGTSLGIRPENMLLAAENGARMQGAIRQIDRILDHTDGYLPNHVFLFFTGNDVTDFTMRFNIIYFIIHVQSFSLIESVVLKYWSFYVYVIKIL